MFCRFERTCFGSGLSACNNQIPLRDAFSSQVDGTSPNLLEAWGFYHDRWHLKAVPHQIEIVSHHGCLPHRLRVNLVPQRHRRCVEPQYQPADSAGSPSSPPIVLTSSETLPHSGPFGNHADGQRLQLLGWHEARKLMKLKHMTTDRQPTHG